MTDPQTPDEKLAYLADAIEDLARQIREGADALEAAESVNERKVALMRIMNPANSMRGASFSLLQVAERELRKPNV